MDAYDFSKPETILGSLNKEFWEGVNAAKWTERRDSLQNLKQLASAPRLAEGDYADVVRELRKVDPKSTHASKELCPYYPSSCPSALKPQHTV